MAKADDLMRLVKLIAKTEAKTAGKGSLSALHIQGAHQMGRLKPLIEKRIHAANTTRQAAEFGVASKEAGSLATEKAAGLQRILGDLLQTRDKAVTRLTAKVGEGETSDALVAMMKYRGKGIDDAQKHNALIQKLLVDAGKRPATNVPKAPRAKQDPFETIRAPKMSEEQHSAYGRKTNRNYSRMPQREPPKLVEKGSEIYHEGGDRPVASIAYRPKGRTPYGVYIYEERKFKKGATGRHFNPETGNEFGRERRVWFRTREEALRYIRGYT